jgi:pimeloyl-ACP methyl ester carboxylesterase
MTSIDYNFHTETKILDPQTRAGLPGRFIELPDGFVHYELAGSSDGLTVVLVHGFSIPYYIWDPTVSALCKAGMRVLRYDLYGRGYSDRPRVDYSLELFNRQLFHLITQLGIQAPIGIAGVSMGGSIAAYFTTRNTSMVRKLCLIDPAGFTFTQSLTTKLIKAPLLGEILLDYWGDKVLVDGVVDDFYQPHRFPEYREKYRDPMNYRGFKRALLSTLRQGVIEEQTQIYRQVRSLNIPSLVFWGKYDKTFPVATVEKVKSILPSAEIQIIDNAGHAAHYEQPEQVNAKMISFFTQ